MAHSRHKDLIKYCLKFSQLDDFTTSEGSPQNQ
jgi:hypothetical protein